MQPAVNPSREGPQGPFYLWISFEFGRDGYKSAFNYVHSAATSSSPNSYKVNLEHKSSLKYLNKMRPTLSVSAAAILSLALSTTLVAAAPFTEEVVIKKTMNAGLYLCENAGFKGYCVHFTTPFGQCSKCFSLLFGSPWLLYMC